MRLRGLLAWGLLIATAMCLLPATAATAYPPTICASLSVSTTHPRPGEAITVGGLHFRPHASIHLVLRPGSHDLATPRADGTGSFTSRVTMPAGLYGRYMIHATTGAPNAAGCPADPFVIMHAQGYLGGSSPDNTGGHEGGTAFTGLDVLLILLAAAVLIGAGVALNRSGKRRRLAASTHQ